MHSSRVPPLPLLLLALPLASQTELQLQLELAPVRTLHVRAQTDGYVTRVHVGVGDAVAALAPLVTIANAALTTELARCDAAIGEAEEEVRPNGERSAIAQIEVQIAERAAKIAAALAPDIKKDLDATQEQLAASENLYRSGRISFAELLDARRDERDLRRRLADAELGSADAKDRLEIVKKQALAIGAAATVHRFHIDKLRAAREAVYARTLMLEVKNVWPAARVCRVAVVQGDIVRAGETELCELIDTSKLTARMTLTGEQLRAIGRDASVQLRIGDGPPFQTKLRHGGALEPNGTVLAQFELDNADGRWFAGERVAAVLTRGEPEHK